MNRFKAAIAVLMAVFILMTLFTLEVHRNIIETLVETKIQLLQTVQFQREQIDELNERVERILDSKERLEELRESENNDG
jgi:hypothetical protein